MTDTYVMFPVSATHAKEALTYIHTATGYAGRVVTFPPSIAALVTENYNRSE